MGGTCVFSCEGDADYILMGVSRPNCSPCVLLQFLLLYVMVKKNLLLLVEKDNDEDRWVRRGSGCSDHNASDEGFLITLYPH